MFERSNKIGKKNQSNEGIITCYIYVEQIFDVLCSLYFIHLFFFFFFASLAVASNFFCCCYVEIFESVSGWYTRQPNGICILLDEIPVATSYWIFLSNNENKTNLKTFTSLKLLCVRQSPKLIQFSIVHVNFIQNRYTFTHKSARARVHTHTDTKTHKILLYPSVSFTSKW